MTSRRDFLTQAGLVAAALVTLPSLKGLVAAGKVANAGGATAAHAAGKGVCGLQLYSLRDQLPKDPQTWIAKVAQAGYKNVETYGLSSDSKFFGVDTKAFKALLDQNHLFSTSGHYGVDEYLAKGTDHDLGLAIDAVHALGQKYLTVPYLGDQFRKTEADWVKVAGQFNDLAKKLKKEGIQMAYHNHNFEFVPVNVQTRGYDLLLKHTDPELVHFEMDLYWVVRGGADPVQLFHEHPGRFVMWHVKDMNKTTPSLNTEVGTGSIDFVKIFKYHTLSGEQQTFMEQENYAEGMDPFTSIAQSAAYIKNKLLV
ncbi:TIM barrel protein [Dinghuibacter silviterrae]|uniref:Sugar phosphate isomerase/epimerase n=1 Tax=Dinghuibacter silviterrae TaxID=1539049 RepID=A0A4R8DTY8_9BACT|nr:TIM barrel protein [Dinghuibacter silviterrae]TDX01800.1 sugar phosphate isomerase/epimerase [Dinghuibacter silviterrae]